MANHIPVKRGGRTGYSTFGVMNPGKGLNNLISDNLINDQESSSLENIMFVESGAPAKAYGFTNVGTGLSNAPRGLGFFNDAIAGTKTLYTVDGTVLKYLNGTVWTAVTGATFDATAQINFTMSRGAIYVLDGVHSIAKVATGGILTNNGHSPKAKFSIYYNGRHYASGVDGQPNRIYISKVLDASEFTTAVGTPEPFPDSGNDPDTGTPNVPGATAYSTDDYTEPLANAALVDIGKLDGDKITGFGKFQDALIVYKERSIYQLTLDSTGLPIISQITRNYGCISHRSIDSVENESFFLTRNGLYVLGNEPNYFNVIRTNELSARIHPIIETINPANFALTTALFNQYVYYLGIPSGGAAANNTTLTYDRRFMAFSKLTHVQPEAFTIFTDTTNIDTVYFTSANSANVYKMTTSYDANGSAISAQWTSKAYDLAKFSLYKRWIWVDILFRQLVGTIQIDIYSDNGNLVKTTSISSSQTGGLGSNLMGGGDELGSTVRANTTGTTQASTNIPYRVKLNIKSRTLKVKVSNARINETFVVLGVNFAFRPYSSFIFPSSQRLN